MLTAFGVVIGTMAVMVLVSLGAGLQRSATGSLGDIANLKRIEVSGAMMGQMAEPVAPSGQISEQSEQEAACLDERGPGRTPQHPRRCGCHPDRRTPKRRADLRTDGGWGQIIGATPEMLEQLGLKAEIGEHAGWRAAR